MGNDAWAYATIGLRGIKMLNIACSQLFATSWLGLGFAEVPITPDKREIEDLPRFALQTSFVRKTLIAIGALAVNKRS